MQKLLRCSDATAVAHFHHLSHKVFACFIVNRPKAGKIRGFVGEYGKKIERRTEMYFTGDTHFNHKNIIRHCKRPFTSTDEMNRFIIDEWNKTVEESDVVYHLGDFAWRNLRAAEEILKQLKGKKFLCIGSHDRKILKLSGYFKEIRESFLIKIGKNQFIFLNHYLHKVWPRSHYGSWHLFGHSHGGMNWYAEKEGKLLDVGVDNRCFRPWSLDEIAEVMQTRPLNFNDLKRRKLA